MQEQVGAKGICGEGNLFPGPPHRGLPIQRVLFRWEGIPLEDCTIPSLLAAAVLELGEVVGEPRTVQTRSSRIGVEWKMFLVLMEGFGQRE